MVPEDSVIGGFWHLYIEIYTILIDTKLLQMVYVSLNFTLKDVGINAADITSFMNQTINNPNSIGFS